MDLLSDEDGTPSLPSAAPAAPAAAAGSRQTRATAYCSTSDRFKVCGCGAVGWEGGAVPSVLVCLCLPGEHTPSLPTSQLVIATHTHHPALAPPQGLKCLYPPGGGAGAVEVTHLDLPRLDADEFLNDTVIDFYIRQGRVAGEVAELALYCWLCWVARCAGVGTAGWQQEVLCCGVGICA